MTIAALFPGQGSQAVGMGADLYTESPVSRDVFDEANRILGFSITDYCFGRGPDANAALTDTAICQPALYTHSVAAMAALHTVPDLVAGHSVGEYAALHACGVLSFADGLRLVRRRGQLMARAGHNRAAGMAAVIGLDDDGVEAGCDELAAHGVAVCANYNSPGQVVISGDQSAMAAAASVMKRRGARRVIPLSVSGAFHSPLMASAREALGKLLAAVPMDRPYCPIYLNVTGKPATDPAFIRSQMLAQLTSPVRWAQTLYNIGSEVDFVEVGPGHVLSGLVKRTLGRKTRVTPVGTADAIASFLAARTASS